MEPEPHWRPIDQELGDIEADFDFLSLVSPPEIEQEWERFDAGGRQRAPHLAIEQPAYDTGPLSRRLEQLEVESIEDSEVQLLLAGKRAELEWQLRMLDRRGTRQFLVQSMLHYSPVDARLIRTARQLLQELPANGEADEERSADEVRRRAERELERYRAHDASLDTTIDQDEEHESLQASHGTLLLPDDGLPGNRLEALVQHEIGAHIVTYHNGSMQPLQVLRNGLANFDELQEGLGVLAEYFASALTATRMRTLAARVVAVHCIEDGADFVDCFRTLDGWEIGAFNAFDITARVYACGGLTRDQIYLRGVCWLLDYLAADGELEPLYIGKIGHAHIPAIQRLRRRGILDEPRLHPHFLEGENAGLLMEKLRRGVEPRELVA